MIPSTTRTGRLALLRTRLDELGTSVAVVTRPENIFYLTNYRASGLACKTSKLHALVVPVRGEPTLLVRSLERRTAVATTAVALAVYDDAEDPYRVLAATVRDAGPERTVGIEFENVSARQHQALQERLRAEGLKLDWDDVSGVVERLALLLDNDGIEHMVAAGRISAAGVASGLAELAIGSSAATILGSVHREMYAAGQTDFEKSFVALWGGPEGGLMHDTRLPETLSAGDIATVEVMGVHDHYYACAQETVAVEGEAPAGFTEQQQLVHAMHDAARAAVRHGATAADVFEAGSAVYRAATGTPYFRRVGGSMGLTTFGLDLVPGNQERLQRGTPLLIQTLVTEPILVACGTTVLVTDDGCQVLTTRVGDALTASPA